MCQTFSDQKIKHHRITHHTRILRFWIRNSNGSQALRLGLGLGLGLLFQCFARVRVLQVFYIHRST